MDAIAPSPSPRLAWTSCWFGQPGQRSQEPHHTISWNSFHSGNALIVDVAHTV